MTAHIDKNHAGADAPTLLKKRRSAESSEGDSRGKGKQSASDSTCRCDLFLVNVILKMGLSVFVWLVMKDSDIAMLNPKFESHRNLSSMLKQISSASFDKTKHES